MLCVQSKDVFTLRRSCLICQIINFSLRVALLYLLQFYMNTHVQVVTSRYGQLRFFLFYVMVKSQAISFLFPCWTITSSANKTRQCVVEERGSGSLAECKFPFKFKESVYDGCKVGYKGTLWCSTQTDDNGNHVNGTGKWGYCKDPLCKLDKRASFEIRKIQLTSFIQQYLGGDDGKWAFLISFKVSSKV